MLLSILTLSIFGVTLALALSFLYFFVEMPIARRNMRTRLAAIQELAIANDGVPDVLRKDLLSDLPFLNQILATMPWISRLRLFLAQGAIRMQVGTFVLI